MSTAEIIAELPHLRPGELARVQARLRELVEPTGNAVASNPAAAHPQRIHSPRLARPEQSKDFTKQIVELAPDAKL